MGMVGALSGSHTSVSGPAAGLSAIVLSAIVSLNNFEIFLLAVVISGVLKIDLGLFKADAIADFMPSNVIKGLLAAIQIKLTAKNQHPMAAVLGFIDSHVSKELIFDVGLGDLFSVRVAGNVVNDDQ